MSERIERHLDDATEKVEGAIVELRLAAALSTDETAKSRLYSLVNSLRSLSNDIGRVKN